MRRRTTIGAVVAVLAVTGCGWTQQDFDAGRSRGNDLEPRSRSRTPRR